MLLRKVFSRVSSARLKQVKTNGKTWITGPSHVQSMKVFQSMCRRGVEFHSFVHIKSSRHLNLHTIHLEEGWRKRRWRVVSRMTALLVDLLFDLTLVSMNPYPCRKDREHNPWTPLPKCNAVVWRFPRQKFHFRSLPRLMKSVHLRTSRINSWPQP